jgi:hypothetical protein
VVADHGDLFFECKFILDFLDLSKSFPHDSDKHVHEDEQKEINGHQEEEPAHHSIRTFGISIKIEFSQRNEENSNDCVEETIPGMRLKIAKITFFFQLFFIVWVCWSIGIKNEEEVGECHDNNGEHDPENLDIFYSLQNEVKEWSSIFEKSHPVEHLHPKKEAAD